MSDEPVVPTEDEPLEMVEGLSNWKFIGKAPSSQEVIDLIKTLPPVWGVDTIDFIDYVEALPQKQKVAKPHPNNPEGPPIVETVEAYTLYMSVAGRVKMAEHAASMHGAILDFEPEPTTPTGIPGLLATGGGGDKGDRIVYREYVTFRYRSEEDTPVDFPHGRKPGMAWVPYSGGSNAAGSNPYEKVETSARGRALAAWGFGVFPGSGIASLEEMRGAYENAKAMRYESGVADTRQRRGSSARKSRDEVLADAFVVLEELRQARGVSEDEADEKVAEYLDRIVPGGARGEDGKVDWSKVRDGQLTLLVNASRQALTQLRDARSEV